MSETIADDKKVDAPSVTPDSKAKELFETVEKNIHDLREYSETSKVDVQNLEKLSGDQKEQIDAMQKNIDESLGAMQNHMKELEKSQLKVSTSSIPLSMEEKSADRFAKLGRAFGAYANSKDKKYTEALDILEKQSELMSTIDNTEGGFLVNDGDVTYREDFIEISPIERLASIKTARNKFYTSVLRKEIPTMFWTGEGRRAQESNSDYEATLLSLNKSSVVIPITLELIEFGEAVQNGTVVSALDLIMNDVEMAFAQGLNLAYVSGNGQKKPQGIITSDQVASVSSEISNKATITDLIRLTGVLKTPYKANAKFLMDKATIANFRLERDLEGQYLWNPLLSTADSQALLGFPIVETPDLGEPDSSGDFVTGVKPIIFGDIRAGYEIFKYEKTLASETDNRLIDGIAEFIFYRWTDGRVVLGEAIKTLEIS